MSTILWIILIFSILLLLAKIAKVFFKKETTLGILILVKTKKFRTIIDKLSKHNKFLNLLTNIGIVLGFGAFGADYLLRKKIKNRFKKIILFIFNSIMLTLIFYFLIKYLIGMSFFSNPLLPNGLAYVLVAITGIMGLSGFVLSSLIFSAYDIIAKLIVGKAACPGVGLVLPGIKMPKIDFFIPWYGWLILIISAAVHEISHGAMLRNFKLKIKSVGIILAGILPLGAFVEPDEKELKKSDKHKITKMYTAGPTSNILICAIFAIILLVISPFANSYFTSINNIKDQGIIVQDVDEYTTLCGEKYKNPAYGNLEKNDIIISVNNIKINNSADFKNAININKENEFIVKNKDTNETKTLNLKANELGAFGFTSRILVDENYKIPFKYNLLKILLNIFYWIAFLNFLIGTVNFMPTVPFDGGFISQNIFSRYLNKKNSKKIRMKKVAKFFGIFILILFLLNIIPYFL
jgi:membrane-associated protease RseP (regulator of RpoE activity)